MFNNMFIVSIGEVEYEPENTAVPYGTQRHRGYDEHIESTHDELSTILEIEDS